MKVLHLPMNIASQMQITVDSLRRIGVAARGMLVQDSAICSSAGLERLCYPSQPRFSGKWFRGHAQYQLRVLSAISWADVVHYHFGGAFALPNARDISWALLLRKACFVTFWGSDIRVPEIEAEGNPYYERIHREPSFEYRDKSTREKSEGLQKFYAERGFSCVIGSESMIAHLHRRSFPAYHLIRCSIDTASIAPLCPSTNRRRVVIVHNPSAPVAKGTPGVLAAIELLRRTHDADFEFVMNHDVPRDEVLRSLQQSDIFLDQFVLGGYGMAAIEAMAMGKVVVCYISPSCARLYPGDLPIVNATLDNLPQVLEQLIGDATLRRDLGMRSRQFVEKYHDADDNAHALRGLYERVLGERRRWSTPRQSPFQRNSIHARRRSAAAQVIGSNDVRERK